MNKSILRSSNCWSLRLALNQKLAGSIPASGAVAVLYWFRNLDVNQVHVGSIPIGHLGAGFRLQATGFRQAAEFILCIRLRVRLLKPEA